MADRVKYFSNGMAGRPFKTNPRLVRSGIASTDYMEMTPVVFQDRFLLLGSALVGAEANPFDTFCLWIEEVAEHRVVTAFAEGYNLGSAFMHDDTFYAYAIPNMSGGAQQIDCFWSNDLQNWESTTVLPAEPGEMLFNESVCEVDGKFIMAFEFRDETHPPFAIGFAESSDLKTWRRIPGVVYGEDRYTACPALRYLDGWFYMFYLEWLSPKWWFEMYLTRSKDLVHWEQSLKNPVLNPEGVEHINSSDIDLVEFEGKVYTYYAYGDQKTWHGVTWAEFDGSLREFLQYYF